MLAKLVSQLDNDRRMAIYKGQTTHTYNFLQQLRWFAEDHAADIDFLFGGKYVFCQLDFNPDNNEEDLGYCVSVWFDAKTINKAEIFIYDRGYTDEKPYVPNVKRWRRGQQDPRALTAKVDTDESRKGWEKNMATSRGLPR